jgi:hypothetical protein
MNYSFYDKLLPFAIRQNDPHGAIKAIVDGTQQGFDQLRAAAIALPSLVDLDQVSGNLLSYLAYSIGVELDVGDAEGLRREQVRAAIPVYKIKGTDLGYTVLLRTLGFQVEVVHLYEDEPDGLITKDASEVILGFNERLPGWHAASRIRVSFYRLPEAQNLEISGIANGMLTSYLLQRILDKIKSITPIHLDVSVVFVWEFFDTLEMEISDSLAIGFDEENFIPLGSCCYHGKGANIVWVRHAYRHDTDVLHDTEAKHDIIGDYAPARLHDSQYVFLDSNYSYHWNYLEYYHDLLPEVWRACCKRGEENAFNLTRWWYTKAELDIAITEGSNIVTSITSLKQNIEIGDFINIDYQYWRITEINQQIITVNRPMTSTGLLQCKIEWIASWHQRHAMHKEPLDFTLPAYWRTIMPTYRVLFDIQGFKHDTGLRHDITGMKHDSCNMEQWEIIESPIVTLLSALTIEFAYYGKFPSNHIEQIDEVSSVTSHITMPANGRITGIAISSNLSAITGIITAKPTINNTPSDLHVTLLPGEITQTITTTKAFFSGMKIGMQLHSNDYSGDGDVFVTLFLELD